MHWQLSVGCAVRHAAVAGCIGIMLMAFATGSRADDFIVYSPHVLATQTEVELRGYANSDGRPEYSGGNEAELSLAHAFTGWWKPELYLAHYQRDPGSGGRLVGYEFENTFQFTQPGELWADFGFLASYEHLTIAGVPDAVEFGPLIEKTAGRFTHIINLLCEKQVGGGASGKYELRGSYSGSYAISAALRAGIEAYVRPNDSAYQAGPVVSGEWHVPGTTGNLEYRAGVVLGINAAAPRQTWLLMLEYEFF